MGMTNAQLRDQLDMIVDAYETTFGIEYGPRPSISCIDFESAKNEYWPVSISNTQPSTLTLDESSIKIFEAMKRAAVEFENSFLKREYAKLGGVYNSESHSISIHEHTLSMPHFCLMSVLIHEAVHGHQRNYLTSKGIYLSTTNKSLGETTLREGHADFFTDSLFELNSTLSNDAIQPSIVNVLAMPTPDSSTAAARKSIVEELAKKMKESMKSERDEYLNDKRTRCAISMGTSKLQEFFSKGHLSQFPYYLGQLFFEKQHESGKTFSQLDELLVQAPSLEEIMAYSLPKAGFAGMIERAKSFFR